MCYDSRLRPLKGLFGRVNYFFAVAKPPLLHKVFNELLKKVF
jgi:hypothetical protein